MSRFQEYLITEANVFSAIKDLIKLPVNKVKNVLQKAYKDFYEAISKAGEEDLATYSINKSLRSLKINHKVKPTELKSLKNMKVNEAGADPEKGGIINWLKSMVFQGTIAANIFTSLQVFFELDKYLQGTTPDPKKILIYAFLWILLSTKAYKDWKKE